ncbi:hypothetical protein [Mycoplasmopsis verecunda]|uniref:HNH endonuclease n=1 Tax=Mycoplasmopsis verecunda TaxID=171291 RepID=A0A1T4L918_9BACT|nr:hypothetical protein [Mycoplasmopsis verecunda]WPB54483.1 hypothetical protein SAM46_03305 [Mycoplasmopsis verecunda]SJZ51245.1 hypothetical protein SAMN02745154_00373 [Mycoplasmopsis verecunda]
MEKNKALQIWEKFYGNKESAMDPYGFEIYKANFILTVSNNMPPHSWNIDHLIPQSSNGKDEEYNLYPISAKVSKKEIKQRSKLMINIIQSKKWQELQIRKYQH